MGQPENAMIGRLLLLAAFLLFVVFPLTAPAADEPAAVVAARASFLGAIKEKGMDPARCSMTFMETIPEGHVVDVKCAELPYMCLMLVHPTEPMAAPVQCVANPDYKPSTKI